MPLAQAGGAIAVLFEEGGRGRAPLLDQRAGVAPLDPLLQGGAPIVAARQNAVAGGRTDRGSRMGVPEFHPLGGQAVQVVCADFGVLVQATHIPIAHIIGQDVNDVWSGCAHRLLPRRSLLKRKPKSALSYSPSPRDANDQASAVGKIDGSKCGFRPKGAFTTLATGMLPASTARLGKLRPSPVVCCR